MNASLYKALYRIRRLEEEVARVYPTDRIKSPVHLSIGQEAVSVGVCLALRPADVVFGTYRSHALYLAKGGDMRRMVAEMYGKATGCARGKGGSMHLIDRSCGFLGAAPILGGTAALAVGAAFGSQMQGLDHVTVAFFGDAAIEEGPFYECVNFAALKQLPVVLVCENNGLSTCSPPGVRQPPGRDIASLVHGMGLASSSGDGNDVLEVCRLASAAVDRARAGGGAHFLEFRTDRWREHCGPGYDFNLGYRLESELQVWQQRCPLRRMERHMKEVGAWDESALAQVVRNENDEIDQAVRFALESPFPTSRRLLEHEFAP